MLKEKNFSIELSEPTGGLKIGKINRTVLTIINDNGELNFIYCLKKFNFKILNIRLEEHHQ